MVDFPLDVAIDWAAQTKGVESHEIAIFGDKASQGIRRSGVGKVLTDGFWLELQRQLVINEKGLFSKFLKTIDYDKTQAYRSINVARKTPKYFAEDPSLFNWFTPEALKILCEAKVNEEARHEAFDLAKQKQFIDIKTANRICKKHGVTMAALASEKNAKGRKKGRSKVGSRTPASEDFQSAPAPTSRSFLHSFVGSAVRLLIESKTPDSKPALKTVIADVRSYLSKLEQHYASLSTHKKQRKAG